MIYLLAERAQPVSVRLFMEKAEAKGF